MNVPQIQTDQELAQIIKSDLNFAVLMFTAPWCGTCRMVYPQVQTLMDQLEHTAFYKLSSDHFAYMNIQSYPHFRVYRNGKLLGDYTGSRVEKIEEFIRDIVQPASLSSSPSPSPLPSPVEEQVQDTEATVAMTTSKTLSSMSSRDAQGK